MKNQHLKPRIYRILSFIMIPMVILVLALFGYTCYKNYLHSIASIEESERSISNSIYEQIKNIEETTISEVYLPDFLYFSNSSQETRISIHAEKFASKLHKSLSNNPMYKGLVMYNSIVDRTYQYNLSGSVFDNDSKYEDIRQQFINGTIKRNTNYVLASINGRTYLAYIVNQRYGSIALLIDPTYNEIFKSVSKLNDDRIIIKYGDNTEFSKNSIPVQVRNYPVFLTYDGFSLKDLIVLDAQQIIIIIVIILLLLFMIYEYLHLNNLLINPLLHLSASFDMIANSDMNYRIKDTSDIYEINQFYTGFNHMLDEIKNAEDESHRQQMDAVQAKLQYLQLQIRPHFYLNCLKNINSLAEMKEYQKIQDLVIYLSDYFRYNFQDVKNFVTVREELEAVQSYVDLCRCLYNTIDLEFDLEPEVLDARTLPLTILTFIENAIKHGAELDQLIIKISSYIHLRDDGEVYVVVKVANTGNFDEETLKRLNQNDPIMVYTRDKVGIANVRYRMWLIYGNNFDLSFYNENEDAVVELSFPVRDTTVYEE